ncbi:MAG: c-type cytochrome biogenesis protein CcsB, partial [Pseudomonadota bacterium]
MDLTHSLSLPQPLIKRLSLADWIYAVLVAAGVGFALTRFGAWMDVYEQGILIGAGAAVIGLGWHWKGMRVLLAVIIAGALASIALYQGDLSRAERVLGLKYFLSSQTAIMW